MKEGETEKTKKYSALCWTENAISQDILHKKLSAETVNDSLDEALDLIYVNHIYSVPIEIHTFSLFRTWYWIRRHPFAYYIG